MTPDDIRHAERRINALHDAIYESLPFRTKSEAHRKKWEDACRAFHAFRHPIFEFHDPEVRRKVRSGIEPWRSDALLFLEVDPWFFRSGYLKERLLRALKGADLNSEECDRLNRVLVAVVDSRERREFRDYCRLAAKVATTALRAELQLRVASQDERLRRRAIEMLRYLDQKRAA